MWNANPDRSRISVLVVEDEPMIRMDVVDLLEEAGYAVHDCGGADAALRVLALHPEISVLFTDVDMPGTMDGLGLARMVATLRPDVRIVVASGRLRPLADEIPGGGAFLAKPYRPDAALAAVFPAHAIHLAA